MTDRITSRERLFPVDIEKLEGASKATELYDKFKTAAVAWQKAHGKEVYYPPPHVDDKDSVVSHVFKVRGDLAALVVGIDNPPRFKADWFAIHPNYRNSNVLKSVIDALQRQYSEIRLQVGTTEKDRSDRDEYGNRRPGVQRKKTDLEDKGQRRKGLLRLYEKFGFRSDNPDWFPWNMTWKRHQENI